MFQNELSDFWVDLLSPAPAAEYAVVAGTFGDEVPLLGIDHAAADRMYRFGLA